MQVLGISGSLRSESHNSRLLSALGALVPAGVELVEWDQLRALPHYDQDLEETLPESVVALREALREADAVVIVTPEYNSSLPGVLKNALDWASRPYATNALRNKPVAVIGASTNDYGAMWARADARRVLGRIGARVIEQEHGVPQAAVALTEDGRIADSEHREALADVMQALVGAAQAQPIAA